MKKRTYFALALAALIATIGFQVLAYAIGNSFQRGVESVEPKPVEPKRISLGRGCTLRGIEGSTDILADCPDSGIYVISQPGAKR